MRLIVVRGIWVGLAVLLLTQCSQSEIVMRPAEAEPAPTVGAPPSISSVYIDPKEETEIERSPETYFFGPNRARQEHDEEEDLAKSPAGANHPGKTRARHRRVHGHTRNHIHENRGKLKN